MRSTYTYVILPLSAATFSEVKRLLLASGYDEQIDTIDGHCIIDLHGIAIIDKDEQ